MGTRARSMALAAALIAAAQLAAAMGAEAQSGPPGIGERLCQGRKPCSVSSDRAAGRDTAGRPLRVIELALGKTGAGGNIRCRPHLREIWIVTGEGASASTRRLMSLCNDGYGAAGIGEDEVKVGPNRLVYRQTGGSNWRWNVARILSLSPARIRAEQRCSYWTGAPGFLLERWNWQRFAGTAILRYQPAKARDSDELGCIPATATHQYLLLPALTGRTGLPRTGAPHLGNCSLTLRDDGTAGFLVYGVPGPPGGATIRALLAGKRDLLVTVEDSAIAGARNWVHSDHIEIWQAGLMSIGREFLEATTLVQFGVGLTDGKVHAGFGRPKVLPEVVARSFETLPGGRQRVSMRIRLPRDGNALTVLYSKAVAGRQARMVASSPVAYGKAESLGGSFPVSPKEARCAVRNGKLDVVVAGDIAALE